MANGNPFRDETKQPTAAVNPFRDAGQQPAAPQPATRPQSMRGGLVDRFTHGATFGFGDELTALESALLGKTPNGGWFQYDQPFSQRYKAALDAERTQNSAFMKSHPIAATSAELVGALSTGMGAARSGLTLMRAGGGLTPNIGRAAAEGAMYGGLYGAGEAKEGHRREGAMKGAAIGGLMGGAIAGGTGGVARALRTRKFAKAAPSRDSLRAAARAAYGRAEGEGLVFRPEAAEAFVAGLSDDLHKLGFDKTLHPRATAAMNRLAELQDDAFTLERLEVMRRVAGNAAKSNDASEVMIARTIQDAIDDFMDNVTPTMLLEGGDPQIASSALRQARHNWSRYKKSEILGEAFEKAEMQATGFENGLRIQFRQIANNKKKMGAFTKEEQKAIRRVVIGGPVENLLKLVGKFSFGRGQATNMLGGTIGAAGGAALGGPIGAAAVPAAAYGARRGAEAMTRSNAQLAEAMVRAGQGAPPASVPPGLQGVPQALSGYAGGKAPMPQWLLPFYLRNQAASATGR